MAMSASRKLCGAHRRVGQYKGQQSAVGPRRLVLTEYYKLYIYILISYFNNILSNRLTAGYTECECSEEELIASQCMGKSILCGSHHACHWIGHRQTIDTESDLRVDGPECAIFQGQGRFE